MAFPVQSIQGLAWQNYTSNALDLIAPFDLDFTTYSEYDIRPSGIFGAQGNRTAAGVVVDNILNSVAVVVTIGPLVETVPPFTKQTIQLTSGSPLVKFVAQPSKLRVSFYAGNYAGSLGGSNFYAAQIAAGLAVETGMIYMFGGSIASIPTGYLLCDGVEVSRAQYPGLFAVIGTVYGVGNGSTTFNLPNMCGRFPLGAGSSGGRTPRALAASGGVESVSLGVAQIPPLTVSIFDPGHTHAVNEPAHQHNLIQGVHRHDLVMQPHNHALSQSEHSHGMNDPTHNHGISDPTHSHGLYDPGHNHLFRYQGLNRYGGTFFTNSLLAGSKAPDNYDRQGGVVGITGAPDSYSFDPGYLDISIAGTGTGQSVYGAGTGVKAVSAYTGTFLNAAVANIGIQSATQSGAIADAVVPLLCDFKTIGIQNYNSVSNISATVNGGNGPHENMPPWLALNFVIKT